MMTAYGHRVEYRGCTLECVPDDDADVWYVHHPSEAADFGSAMTLDRARVLVDRLIRNGDIPGEAPHPRASRLDC